MDPVATQMHPAPNAGPDPIPAGPHEGLTAPLTRRTFLQYAGAGAAAAGLPLAWGAAVRPARGANGGRSGPPGDSLATGATLQLPLWGDGAGWNGLPYYEAIVAGLRQGAARSWAPTVGARATGHGTDLTGTGRDALLGRGPAGLLVDFYDGAVGQWRDLAAPVSPPPGGGGLWPDPTWTEPQNFRTIQAADVDGDGKAELISRAPGGIEVYRYDPDTGALTQLAYPSDAAGNPVFSDASTGYARQYYLTIQAGDIDGDGQRRAAGARRERAGSLQVRSGHGHLARPRLAEIRQRAERLDRRGGVERAAVLPDYPDGRHRRGRPGRADGPRRQWRGGLQVRPRREHVAGPPLPRLRGRHGRLARSGLGDGVVLPDDPGGRHRRGRPGRADGPGRVRAGGLPV